MILASAVLIFNVANLIRSSKVQQLSDLAKVLGANSTAALTFDDPAAAKELLKSLEGQPTIRYACVFNAKGKVFAAYRSKEEKPDFAPRGPGEIGYEFVPGGFLDVTQEIVRDKERIGTVYLHASMTDLNEQIVNNVIIRCGRHARRHCGRVLPLRADAADRLPADPRTGGHRPGNFAHPRLFDPSREIRQRRTGDAL